MARTYVEPCELCAIRASHAYLKVLHEQGLTEALRFMRDVMLGRLSNDPQPPSVTFCRPHAEQLLR